MQMPLSDRDGRERMSKKVWETGKWRERERRGRRIKEKDIRNAILFGVEESLWIFHNRRWKLYHVLWKTVLNSSVDVSLIKITFINLMFNMCKCLTIMNGLFSSHVKKFGLYPTGNG